MLDMLKPKPLTPKTRAALVQKTCFSCRIICAFCEANVQLAGTKCQLMCRKYVHKIGAKPWCASMIRFQ